MPSGYLKTLDGTRIEIVDAKAREDIETLNSGKVDAETGKSLSTNDYDNAAKAKVDAIPSNPKYTDTVYDDTEVRTQISGKLTEPESGIVAGKYFKVKSVDEDGHAVLEACDLPIAINQLGMIKGGFYSFQVLSDGTTACNIRDVSTYNSLNNYNFISKGTIENIKTDLVGRALADTNATAYTLEQQSAALSRLGAVGGKFELIDEITLTEDTGRITLTTEPNGTAYKFSAVAVLIDAKISSGYGTYDAILYDKNDEILGDAPFNGLCTSTVATNAKTIFMNIGGFWVNMYTACVQSSNWWTTAYVQETSRGVKIQINNEPCVKIYISNRNNPVLAAGSIIKIYAIRA